MGPSCVLVFVLLISLQHALCYSGDPVMYLPPYELRTMRDGRQPGFVANPQLQTGRSLPSEFQSQPILHTSPAPTQLSQSGPRLDKGQSDTRNFTFSEIYDALTNVEDNRNERYEELNKNEHQEVPRSAYDYPASPYGYRPPPYGYQRPSYGPYGYQESSYVPPAPAPAHHSASKISLLKPDLGDLVKPVTTKVAGKVSGLIGLVLALLTGSAPNDLELKGFKDIIINGIVKPLLVAKGGIKSLISKLTIPVISLLLINLEVLITIWWLWEDCPEQSPPPPYSYPKPSYGYNSYR